MTSTPKVSTKVMPKTTKTVQNNTDNIQPTTDIPPTTNITNTDTTNTKQEQTFNIKTNEIPSVSSTFTPTPTMTLTNEKKWQHIAEKAYYLAIERNFTNGTAEEDWYKAEQEIKN